jgi:hypothetical protein
MAGVISYLFVFFLIGYWHGAGSQFALSGLLFGVAASITKLIQIMIQRGFLPRMSFSGSSVLTGGIGLGMCAFALIATWPIFSSANDVISIFGSLLTLLGTFFVICLVGIFVRIAGIFVDWFLNFKNMHSTIAAIKYNPYLIGAALVVMFAVKMKYQDEISSIVYYQQF